LLVASDQVGHPLRNDARLAECRGGKARPHFGGQLITLPGHGPDEIGIPGKGLAQCRDLRLQCVFIDDLTGPDGLQQIVLADECAARLDKPQQDVEGAVPDLQRFTVGKHLAPARNDFVAPEFQDPTALVRLGIHGTYCSGSF
jgi:hypothetical protein